MTLTILFERDKNGYTVDPLVEAIRKTARADGWAGMPGFKEWAKSTYNATLRAGMYDDWTSINFKTSQDMYRFKQNFGVNT